MKSFNELASLREWRELADAQDLGTNPHVLQTNDLQENKGS